MREPVPYGAMDVVPNRLAEAKLHRLEVSTILGEEDGQREFQMNSFNWVAAFLHDEVGLDDEGIVDWFREPAPGLGGSPPLLVWADRDGFWKVFEYAQFVKHQADEEHGADERSYMEEVVRSHQMGNYVLELMREGFEITGIDLDPENAATGETEMQAVHNPHSNNQVLLVWKGGFEYETYKMIVNHGESKEESTYFITRCLAEGEPFIIQSGIIKEGLEDMDSSIDGRPPSAGELASFAIPLSKEVQNRSFIPVET